MNRKTGKYAFIFGTIAMIICGCSYGQSNPVDGEIIPPTETVPSAAVEKENTEPSAAVKPEPDSKTEEAMKFPVTTDDMLKRTLSYAQRMSEGDFSFTENFAEVLAEELSEKDLKSAWKSTVKGLGEPMSFDTGEASFTGSVTEHEGLIEGFDGYLVVTADIFFEEKGVNLTITYNPALQIEALYLTYILLPIEPEQTEYYTERELLIGEGEELLDGILTLPAGVVNPPVFLLIQGSGQSDLNETVGAAGNTPFADLAHGLAEQGIATLRYNKRYYQYPETATEDMTIYDEVLNDVKYALSLLEDSGEVDANRIYVLGHSLGGMLAPWIAMENTQVAGFVSLAGSPRPLWEIIFDQSMAMLESMDLTDAERKELQALVQAEYDRVQELTDAVVRGTKLPLDYNLSEAIFGVSGYYWASLAEIDAVKAAQGLTISMLFLQGSEDFQVSPEEDYQYWQTLLADCDNAEFEMFGGLNHLFMESSGEGDISEYDIEGHVAPEVIQRIAVWVQEQ